MRRAETVEEALDPERVRVAERPGLPMYQPIDSPPCSARIAPSRSPISSIAVSQETRSKLPSGRRRCGWSTRSGSFWTSVIAIPFGQAKPFDSGCSLSGRSFVTLPSSTVATMPHSGSQIRQ